MSEPKRSGRELEIALSNAKQNITLLRTQLQTGRIDAKYFDQRLEALATLLEDIDAENKNVKSQRRVAALYEVSRVIGSSLNLQTVLDQVMDAIIQLTAAERGFLMLLDDDGKLTVRVARNFDQETLGKEDMAFSRTITRQVFESGEPVVTTNAQEDPRYAGQASIIAHAMRSIMASPLRARGQIIGVVYVDNRIRAGLFSEEDLDALDAFATQAAVALDNARLYTQTDAQLQARLEELQILQWIDRQLNESLDANRTMYLTLEWASRLAHAHAASMGLIDYEAGEIYITATYGDNSPFADTMQIPLRHPLIAEVVEGGRPVQQDLLAVPIRLENTVIGVMVFAAKGVVFDDAALELVSRMADRAAIALKNGQLYQAVKAADRAKTEFVSVVAHELKVPMTSIRGYASMLGMVGPLQDKQNEFVKVIVNNVERMKILVDDLSDISRIESGQLKMDLQPIDITDVANQAVDGVMAQIQDRGHQFVQDIAPRLPQVLADPSRLVQVLINLLSNAYKYTPDGGKITFAIKPSGNVVQFSIQDTGIGMTADQIAKLGTKFFRVAENEHVAQQSGTGLGFVITRNLIELMGGSLDIESQIGHGSAFSFRLPVA